MRRRPLPSSLANHARFASSSGDSRTPGASSRVASSSSACARGPAAAARAAAVPACGPAASACGPHTEWRASHAAFCSASQPSRAPASQAALASSSSSSSRKCSTVSHAEPNLAAVATSAATCTRSRASGSPPRPSEPSSTCMVAPRPRHMTVPCTRQRLHWTQPIICLRSRWRMRMRHTSAPGDSAWLRRFCAARCTAALLSSSAPVSSCMSGRKNSASPRKLQLLRRPWISCSAHSVSM
mmetsp:Transcript_74072/g.178894  ORF Transcript_74072/g.178894 Transcript_74072/m.178894 type:complete len:241 (+) Transcript_74072:458-1180(+)